MRIYSGCHVAIRLLLHLEELNSEDCKFLENQSIIELGCGVGFLSFLGTKLTKAKRLVLTDSYDSTLEVAKINYHYLADRLDKQCDFNFENLQWGNEKSITQLLEKYTDVFDVVIASELMYYSTPVDLLIETVMAMTSRKGQNSFLIKSIMKKIVTELLTQFRYFYTCSQLPQIRTRARVD